jgi:hypothetical protein
MSSDDDFLREINAIAVPASLLGEVTTLWASLPEEEWRDFDRRLGHVLAFVGERVPEDQAPMLAMATALRVLAIHAIVHDPKNRAWLFPGSQDDITYLHGDVVKTAAQAELVADAAGEPVFFQDAFRTHLLTLAAAKGRA